MSDISIELNKREIRKINTKRLFILLLHWLSISEIMNINYFPNIVSSFNRLKIFYILITIKQISGQSNFVSTRIQCVYKYSIRIDSDRTIFNTEIISSSMYIHWRRFFYQTRTGFRNYFFHHWNSSLMTIRNEEMFTLVFINMDMSNLFVILRS